MGKKSSYFRHTFDAHDDEKMIQIFNKRNGLAVYGFYFVLLELYGRRMSNDDENNIEQTINVHRLCSICRIRRDSVLNNCKLLHQLSLIVLSQDNLVEDSIKLSIPNFLKYYGSYKKTSDLKVPNKRKEKQRKEKEIKKPKNDSGLDGFMQDAINVFNEVFNAKRKKPSKGNDLYQNLKKIYDMKISLDDLRLVAQYKKNMYEQFDSLQRNGKPITVFRASKIENAIEDAKQFANPPRETRNGVVVPVQRSDGTFDAKEFEDFLELHLIKN